MSSDVTKQKHYTRLTIQPAEYSLNNYMGYAEGCVIKYISRYKHKGKPVEDLKKARHYIDMLIEREEKGEVIL